MPLVPVTFNGIHVEPLNILAARLEVFTPASKSEASQFNVIKNPDSVAPEVPIVHVLLTDFVGTIPEELI